MPHTKRNWGRGEGLTMRVCHKCGAVDPPEWKHVKWSYYIDACSFENFEMLYPNLAKTLLKEGTASDKHYAYRVTLKKEPPHWVERKAKIDFTMNWDDLCEKFPHINKKKLRKRIVTHHEGLKDFLRHWSKIHPNQTKLLQTKKEEKG